MKTLIAQPSSDYLSYYSYLLESNFDLEFIKCNTALEAINYLKTNGHLINLIIIDHNLLNFPDFLQYKDKLEEIPPLIITYNDKTDVDIEEHRKQKLYQHNSDLLHFIELVENFFNGKYQVDNSSKQYSKIRIDSFFTTKSIPVDAYIKLGQDKYVKIINKNSDYTEDMIKKYSTKSIYFLYVLREDFPNLFDSFFNDLLKICEVKSSIFTEDFREVFPVFCHEVVNEFIRNVGINEKVVQITDNAIKSTLNIIKKHHSLLDLWKKVINHQNYLSEHSIMTAYMASAMAQFHDKYKSDKYILIFTISSFMHDLMIDDSDLAQVDSIRKDLVELTQTQLAEIKNHPFKTSELIKTLDEIPDEAITIIKQHHEKPDGSGFPNKLKHNEISELTAFFQIAHQFISDLYLINKLTEGVVKNILQEYGLDYSHPIYKDALECLSKELDESFMPNEELELIG